jgi:hypothetical protein
MQQSIRLSLSLAGTAAIALTSIPFGAARADDTKVAQGTAKDLGVMSISLKDAIQPNFGFQGALQGAGTPNQSGIGGFLPLAIGDNSVFFLDAQANANFADFNEYSSIINTKVAGTTISTSTRLGYRFLNSDRSWMFGVNAGYDSRPLATGGTDNGIYVTDSKSVFFQQVEHEQRPVPVLFRCAGASLLAQFALPFEYRPANVQVKYVLEKTK